MPKKSKSPSAAEAAMVVGIFAALAAVAIAKIKSTK